MKKQEERQTEVEEILTIVLNTVLSRSEDTQ